MDGCVAAAILVLVTRTPEGQPGTTSQARYESFEAAKRAGETMVVTGGMKNSSTVGPGNSATVSGDGGGGGGGWSVSSAWFGPWITYKVVCAE